MKTRDFIYKQKTKMIMKTGGTLNFLKKAGAVLMLVAVFASSCNKYADDFKQLNTKLDALAVQVAGVTQLSTDMAALKTQVAAVQTAVAGLPGTASITALSTALAATDAKVTTVSANLTALAAIAAKTTDVTASQAALTVLINKVTTDLTATIGTQVASLTALANSNQTAVIAKLTAQDAAAAANLTATTNAITALGTSIAAQITATNGMITAQTATQLTQYNALVAGQAANVLSAAGQDAQLLALVNTNAAQTTAINATLANTVATLADLNTAPSTSTIAALVAAMQLQITAMQQNINVILASTSYNGDVILNNDTQVAFFLPKIAQLAIVNGNVTVDPTNITAAQIANLPTITKAITTVSGATNTVTVNFAVGSGVDFSNLVSVADNLVVTGGAKANAADCKLTSLNTVMGNLVLNYDGAYASSTLQKVGGYLVLQKKAVVAASSPLGTTSINIPNVAVTGSVYDNVALATPGVLTYAVASSIIMSGGVSSLTADAATTITLGTVSAAAGLTISSSLTAPAVVSLPNLTGIVGAGSFTTFGASAVNLPVLATNAGGLAIVTGTGGTVDLTKYNAAGGLTVTGPAVLTLPAMAAGAITSSTATNVTLAKHDWAIVPTLGAVTDLSATNVANPVNLNVAGFATLKNVTINGNTSVAIPATAAGYTSLAATVTIGAANTAMKTIAVGGRLKSVSITGVAPQTITSVTTSGVINDVTIANLTNASLTALTLGHTHFVGGPGSTLDIQGCTALTSLTTSTDMMKVLRVRGNTSLTSANFASYVTVPAVAATVTIDIWGNKLSGTFTPAATATFSTPYVEAKLTCASLLTLKAYVAACNATSSLVVGPYTITLASTVTFDNDLDSTAAYLYLGSFLYPVTAVLTNGAMAAAQTVLATTSVVIDDVNAQAVAATTNGINTYGEWSLLQ